MDGLVKEWYKHMASPVTTASPYDQRIHFEGFVTADKPDIVLEHNAERL